MHHHCQAIIGVMEAILVKDKPVKITAEFLEIFFVDFVFFSVGSAVKKWWNLRQAQRAKEVIQPLPQWELDYNLEALPEHHMFWEYLEVGKQCVCRRIPDDLIVYNSLSI
mgnify:CR=1 FL=1